MIYRKEVRDRGGVGRKQGMNLDAYDEGRHTRDKGNRYARNDDCRSSWNKRLTSNEIIRGRVGSVGVAIDSKDWQYRSSW